MTQEPETLYKLMTLYMLDRVNYPMTTSQLSEFFIGKEYTNYFTLMQVVLKELVDSELILSGQSGNATRYEITPDGREILGYFKNDIPAAVLADIDEYLKAGKFRLRSEIGVTSDYYKEGNKNYVVHCEVREGRTSLISLDLSVPDEHEAEIMCDNWSKKCQAIYAACMRELMSGE